MLSEKLFLLAESVSGLIFAVAGGGAAIKALL
jgi:hypothetical protein